MLSWARPNRAGSGSWTTMRLPHGHTVSTPSLVSRKENLVPSRFFFTSFSRSSSAARDHEAGGAAQDVRLAGRQVELAHPDIDPHDADAGVEKGVAGEPEAAH